jgi:hypothetical protein
MDPTPKPSVIDAPAAPRAIDTASLAALAAPASPPTPHRSLGNRTRSGSRRIGERVLGWNAVVVWRADKRAKTLVRRSTGAVAAQLLDVSISGAQLEVDLGAELPVGAVVGVTIDGLRAVVEVKRVEPGVTGRLRCYGIEWRELEPDLQYMLHQYLARSEPVPDQRSAIAW